MNTPNDASDSQIANLYDEIPAVEPITTQVRKLDPTLWPTHVLGPVARPTETNAQTQEHPTASFLYRKFKAGSAMLTKDEAYRIANEIDRLANESAYLIGLGRSLSDLSQRMAASIETLSKLP